MRTHRREVGKAGSFWYTGISYFYWGLDLFLFGVVGECGCGIFVFNYDILV